VKINACLKPERYLIAAQQPDFGETSGSQRLKPVVPEALESDVLSIFQTMTTEGMSATTVQLVNW